MIELIQSKLEILERGKKKKIRKFVITHRVV